MAILLGNSLELPVAYLALMKLGAVFVPMDPGWPDERLRTALSVLSPRLILCAEPGDVPGEFRAASAPVAVDAIAPCSRRPEAPLTPADLCYGFFTSGTTGTPKCALNRHGGLANRLRFMTRWFGADRRRRGAAEQQAHLRFFAVAAAVAADHRRPDGTARVWRVPQPAADHRHDRPAPGHHHRLRVEHLQRAGRHRRRRRAGPAQAVVAALPDRRAARRSTRARCTGCGRCCRALAITNGYGPTETSIGMVFHLVSDADGDAIPIGRPIDNCYVAVLDDDRDPLPRGAVGEIAIGGACVGAGYHGDPAATRRAFIPNRFPGQIPGDQLYLSGDFGYLDERGRLFFAGRTDFQVKIGGVRIELGEIEAAAQRCPGVYQAKALVAERDGVKSLALFAAGKDTLTADGAPGPACAGRCHGPACRGTASCCRGCR